MSDLEMKYFEMLFNLIVDLHTYIGLCKPIIIDEEASENLLESMARFLNAFNHLSNVAMEEASNLIPDYLPKSPE